MPTKQKLAFIQGDDPTAAIEVTRDGVALDLTGKRIEVIVKATEHTPDAKALYTLSSEGVTPRITVTDAPGGLATADFTDRLDTAGFYWYRAYIADETDPDLDRLTFAFGDLEITAA